MGPQERERKKINPKLLTMTWESPFYLVTFIRAPAAFWMTHFFTTDSVIFIHVKMRRVAGVDPVIVTLAS